jgi:hypothetical protein
MTAPSRRGVLAGAWSTALTGALTAACGGAEAGAPVADTPHPAVTQEQATRILRSVDTALDQSFTARDPRRLGRRVTGPAARTVAARLRVAAKLGRTVQAPGPLALRRLVLPASGDWPRWFAAAGEVTGQPTPVVRVLRSVSAREPFGLWGELLLLPGATLPALASPQTGTPLLPPDQTGLLATPTDVLTRYAKALTATTPGRPAEGFALDQFREQVAGQLAADRRTLGQIADVDTVHRPSAADGMLALRTADGGALVVAALEQLYRVRVRQAGGPPVNLDADLAALAGVPRVARSLQRTAVELLAFHVPPARGGQIRLIAAAKGDVSAVGS